MKVKLAIPCRTLYKDLLKMSAGIRLTSCGAARVCTVQATTIGPTLSWQQLHLQMFSEPFDGSLECWPRKAHPDNNLVATYVKVASSCW